jgi:hypothetical protein
MAASRDRLASERAGRRWLVAWRAAAAVILVLNVGMSAVNGVRFQRLAAPDGVEPRAARRGLPDAFDPSDHLHSLAASALASVTPAPDAGALSRHLFSHEEEREWAIP